jgi:hypothetical protein
MAKQKSAAKKTKAPAHAAIKKTPGAVDDAQRDDLAKKLRSLIPKLNAEGLAFLLEQAQVHLYNMQVDRINEAEAARTSKSKAASVPSASPEDFSIEAAGSGSSYYLVYKGEWIMFSRNEMVHVVNIINAGGTDLETQERLFNWLARERSDVLSAIYVKDKFDGKLKTISALVKKTFKVRKAD